MFYIRGVENSDPGEPSFPPVYFVSSCGHVFIRNAYVYSRGNLEVSREQTEKPLGRILWPFLILDVVGGLAFCAAALHKMG